MTSLRLRYQTYEFPSQDIHLCTLRDRQQFHDPDGEAEVLGISSATWPLFGLVWPSSLVLAQYMNSYAMNAPRILEIGCGIGLPSIVLNTKNADITATDHHPEAGKFLRRNTGLNDGNPVAFERVDWADEKDSLGLFDVIIGSDILYEDQHIKLLSDFIEGHANPKCEIILVDPGRGRKAKLIRALQAQGYTSSLVDLCLVEGISPDFKGYIIKLVR